MGFAPIGLATITPPSVSSGGGIGSTLPQPANITLPPQFNPVFTNSPPFTTSVQGGSASGLLSGWDPVTGLGMPPGSFTPSTQRQTNASASQQMGYQQNVLVSQPIEQSASASQPMMQNMLAFQPMGQTNASALHPMVQHQHTASLIQSITPTEVLIS